MDDLPPMPNSASRPSRTDRFTRLSPPAPALGDPVVGRAVARSKQGDVDALHFLYVRYADEVFGLVESLVHDAALADRITQVVFRQLTTSVQRYEQRDAPFATWILRIARRAAVAELPLGASAAAGGLEEPGQLTT